MTTISDIIKLIDLTATEDSKSALVNGADISEFDGEFFDSYSGWSEEFNQRVIQHWVPGATWICTDTRVGVCVYTFDSEVVAIGSQPARKCSHDIEFVSTEAYHKLRNFYLKCINGDNDITLITMDSEVDNSWFEFGKSK